MRPQTTQPRPTLTVPDAVRSVAWIGKDALITRVV